jgi:hypothetical protein
MAGVPYNGRDRFPALHSKFVQSLINLMKLRLTRLDNDFFNAIVPCWNLHEITVKG